MTNAKKPESLGDDELDTSTGGTSGMQSHLQIAKLRSTHASNGALNNAVLQNDLALMGKISS